MFRDSERAKAEQVRRETKNMYESDKRAKDNFERWKKKRFSQYDRDKHDDFLKDRHRKNNEWE